MGGNLRDVLTADEAERVAEVFATHQAFIEAVAKCHAQTPDHVPDIVQTVGVTICRALNGFRDESQITTWLYRMTVNTARTYYQREHRQQRIAEAVQLNPDPDVTVDPDAMVIDSERAAALDEAIELLLPQHRAAIRNDLQGSLVLSSSRWTRLRARRRLKELLATDPRVD